MNEEILEKITNNEIPLLIENFKMNFKKYYPLTQYLEIYQEYKDRNIDEPKQTLFRYGGVEDGVYVVETIFSDGGTPYINFFIYTAGCDTFCIRKVLSQTKRIPWHSRGYSIQAVLENIAPVIREVGVSKEVDLKCVEGFMMLPPPVEAFTAGEVPEDVILKYLNSDHVPEICHMWPNKFPGSEFYLETQIKNNFGIGLFRKTDDKMMSSAISFHSGGIFVLNTHPEFRGRGYAEIVVRNMIKESYKQGRIPFAMIHKGNNPSQKLFEKIGFKEFSEVEHIFPRDFR